MLDVIRAYMVIIFRRLMTMYFITHALKSKLPSSL